MWLAVNELLGEKQLSNAENFQFSPISAGELQSAAAEAGSTSYLSIAYIWEVKPAARKHISNFVNYYCYYLLKLSVHSVAVVLTLVQTNQIRIYIHKRNNTKTQYKQYKTQ